jgi:hypothetical protein
MPTIADAIDRIEQTLAGESRRSDSEFNESDHPRAEDGKFGGKSGGKKAPASAPNPTSKAPDNLSDKEKKSVIKNLPPNVGSMFNNVFKNYKKLTEENKQKVFEKFTEISDISEKTGDELENAVFSIDEVKGCGISGFVLNNAIRQWKLDIQEKAESEIEESYTQTRLSAASGLAMRHRLA